MKSSWKFLHELMTNDKLQHIKRWTHCFVCLSSSVHLKSFLKFLTLYLMYISTIQGFWQVAEEKVKFYGIFRDKFAEKLANFAVISLEFSGQTSPKSNYKKTADLMSFPRQISLGINRLCADQTSIFNVFLTEVIICSFNNNTLQKWTNGKAFKIMVSASFLQHNLSLVVLGCCLHVSVTKF